MIAVPADVTDRNAVDQAAETVSRQLGGLDILVNTAATPLAGTGGSLETVNDQQMLSAAVPYMKQRGWGRLIHIGGLLARQASSYAPRNLAIIHLSKTLPDELGPYGITSNVVHPGATRGARLAESLASRSQARKVPEAELEAELASA